MLFGRGHWAVFGVKNSSLSKFRKNLNSEGAMFDLSQLAAAVRAKYLSMSAVGINPYAKPRKDENASALATAASTNVINYLQQPDDVREALSESEFAILSSGYGSAEEFELPDPNAKGIAGSFYAFWLVTNAQKDVTDAASKKEQVAYDEMGKPFKFLNKEEKAGVETTVISTAVVERKQFPVLVDFEGEKVYVAASTEGDIEAVQNVLRQLGAETFALAWQFGGFDWVTQFLNKVNIETKFESEMAERAEELTRLRKDEIEKMDDKMMESIVSNFYALSELESGQWCGLTTPARIRIYKPADPIGTAGASLTFSLLRLSDDSQVAASAVVFQSLECKTNKKGDEKQVRRDLFTLDLNDNINLLEVGAGLLRGFDLPGFRKEIKTAIKAQSDGLAISDYWKLWLTDMREAVHTFVDNITDSLNLDKTQFGLLPFAFDGEKAKRETAEV